MISFLKNFLCQNYNEVPNNNKYFCSDRPKNWEVCGSNDRIEWEVIDNRSNDSYLSNYGNYHTYECNRSNKNYYCYASFDKIIIVK